MAIELSKLHVLYECGACARVRESFKRFPESFFRSKRFYYVPFRREFNNAVYRVNHTYTLFGPIRFDNTVARGEENQTIREKVNCGRIEWDKFNFNIIYFISKKRKYYFI